MDYYKGINGKDVPQGGGAYVTEMGDAHEKYNFQVEHLTSDQGYPEEDYCLGFVETKSTNHNTRNQLNIERIEGCELLKNELSAEDVLVIYCALYPLSDTKETYVVGWYKHAVVYRHYESIRFLSDDPEGFYV